MSESLTLSLPPSPPETVTVELDADGALMVRFGDGLRDCVASGQKRPGTIRELFRLATVGQRAERDGIKLGGANLSAPTKHHIDTQFVRRLDFAGRAAVFVGSDCEYMLALAAESAGRALAPAVPGYPPALVDALLDAVNSYMGIRFAPSHLRHGEDEAWEALKAAYNALRPRVPESPVSPPPSPPVDARGNVLRQPQQGEWYWSPSGRWFLTGYQSGLGSIRWTAPGPDKPTLPPVSVDYDHGAAARLNAEIAAKAQTNTDASDLAETRRQRDEWKSLFERVEAQRDEWDRLYHEAANKRDAESARANRAEADLAAFRALGLTPDQLRLCMAKAYGAGLSSGWDQYDGIRRKIESDQSMHPPLLAAWNAETEGTNAH